MEIALKACGIGHGDEVITTSNTAVPTVTAIVNAGAKPCFVDVNEFYLINTKLLENKINKNTKAIMPVHLYGQSCDMKKINNLAKKYNLHVIEDCAQSHGATYFGKKTGSLGDIGCFSFDFVKTITCGEGGAIVTNNELYKLNADHFSDHGHDHSGNDRGKELHPFLGYNFRISELHAAVGLAQVRRLKEVIALQKKYYTIIRDVLSKIPQVTFRSVPVGGEESYAFLNFFLPNIEMTRQVSKSFKESNIDACFHYYDNNWHYIRKWQHLSEIKSLYPLSQEVVKGLRQLKNKTFSQSDHYIGRNLSCLIKLSWTEQEVQARALNMANCIKIHCI